MTIQTCKLFIDSKPYSFDVEGNFSWGKNIYTFIEKGNIISKTLWIKDGYTIEKIFNNNDQFDSFYSDVRRNIILAMKANNIEFDESKFELRNYHKLVNNDELHNKVINITRNLTEQDFSLDLKKLLHISEEILSSKLSLKVKELNRVHLQIRINRPNSLDINPPHKDGYLSYWKNIINIWIPIEGCNMATSLPIIPGSHLWSENQIFKTTNKGSIINGNKYMVPCILKLRDRDLEMIRPDPLEGEAIFFTPFLIHGAAFNNSNNTRIAMELRFPKFGY